MTAECWKPVVGYEGRYEVSNRGRVRSVDRTTVRKNGMVAHHKGRILKTALNGDGYWRGAFSQNGRMRSYKVHVLVCEAFHGPKPEWAHCARHLNGISTDNRPENLAWGTRSENMQDKARHGTNHWLNKTHCKWGHEFTPENIRYEREGRKRSCRQCARDRNRQRRAIRKGVAA